MAGHVDTLEPGTQIDFYRIEAPVARSQSTTVYRAIDVRNDQPVALKVPRADMEEDPVLYDRFRREASIGEKLNHPGVMRVYSEEERSRIYMVMEWCEGRTLRRILDDGKIEPDRAIRIAVAILDALQYIHDNGIAHRGLRPENIIVSGDDKVKLIDFGVAADATARRLTYTNLTAAIGSSNYISPEQVQGKRGDGRSDIYAMGVILYEMLAGRLPFSGSSPMEVMNDRVLNHPMPPSVAEPTISPQLQEVLYRALEPDPHDRYARARDFAADLKHLDQVGVQDRAELRDWRKRKSNLQRKIIFYFALALVPVAILIAMALLSRH